MNTITLSDIRRGSSLLNSINSNPSTALKLATILNQIDSSNFDIFELDALAQRKTLFLMSNEIFNRYSFLDYVDEDKFKEFIDRITVGYDRKITYHNVISYFLSGFACRRCLADLFHDFKPKRFTKSLFKIKIRKFNFKISTYSPYSSQQLSTISNIQDSQTSTISIQNQK